MLLHTFENNINKYRLLNTNNHKIIYLNDKIQELDNIYPMHTYVLKSKIVKNRKIVFILDNNNVHAIMVDINNEDNVICTNESSLLNHTQISKFIVIEDFKFNNYCSYSFVIVEHNKINKKLCLMCIPCVSESIDDILLSPLASDECTTQYKYNVDDYDLIFSSILLSQKKNLL